MSGESTYTPGNGFSRWLDDRLPVMRLVNDSFVDYPTPRNLNYWWTFGGILTFCLAVQIVTGIVLAMHYSADTSVAFASVEHIMRDVNSGWLMRYLHANGASFFFIVAATSISVRMPKPCVARAAVTRSTASSNAHSMVRA